MDEERRRLLEEAVSQADPRLVEKFGNPLDENDPRNWPPSVRAEKGLSLEEQVRLMGLDVEAQSLAFAHLAEVVANIRSYVNEMRAEALVEELKRDPESAVKKMMAMLNGTTKEHVTEGAWGPNENSPDAPVRYAGSTQGISPDQLVETPDGRIRADQIPGYRNDPNWQPSPDWVEANCMCDNHKRLRAQSNQFGIDPYRDDDPPRGMYL